MANEWVCARVEHPGGLWVRWIRISSITSFELTEEKDYASLIITYGGFTGASHLYFNGDEARRVYALLVPKDGGL